jgi:hypothetical protein
MPCIACLASWHRIGLWSLQAVTRTSIDRSDFKSRLYRIVDCRVSAERSFDSMNELESRQVTTRRPACWRTRTRSAETKSNSSKDYEAWVLSWIGLFARYASSFWTSERTSYCPTSILSFESWSSRVDMSHVIDSCILIPSSKDVRKLLFEHHYLTKWKITLRENYVTNVYGYY